jgi:tetratricopeptide (TPR) repeat protein
MHILMDALLKGAYAQALQRLDALEKNGTIGALEQRAKRLEPVAVEASAVAELYFYMGRNDNAMGLLGGYAKTWPATFERHVGAAATRTRLQLAEYFYCQGDYAKAADIARDALTKASHAADTRGTAEASYFLMRILRRSHSYSEITDKCHAAIEAFTAASRRGGVDKTVLSWRLGLVYLVAGFTQWRAGNLAHAMGLLHTADFLLQTSGDFIARANVRHTFGVILRSRGRLDEALKELQAADGLYEKAGHQLNRARVNTDIGRVYLDGGNWKAAHEALRIAGDLSRSCKSLRQQEEAALWSSWLAQIPGTPYFNLDHASEQAEVASKSEALMVRVEGHIAYGYALAAQGSFDFARDEFNSALETAQKTEMAKHLANAQLSLADFYSRYSPLNLPKADSHYRDAAGIITQESSMFLRKKLDAVGKQIAVKLTESKDQSLFIRAIEDVFADGLTANKGMFGKWAMASALKKANGDWKQAADWLQMDEEYLRKQFPAAHRKRSPKPVRKQIRRFSSSLRARKRK